MSLMFPSMKQQGNKTTIAASPLSTPALNTARPKSANHFQPIGLAHSESSTSLGEGVLTKESSRSEDSEENKPAESSEVETEASVDVTQERTETGRSGGNCKSKSASVHIRDERCTDIADLEPSVHQRSRSNEIDYVSLRSDVPKAGSAFRSPPGSLQTFKPLVVSHRDNNQDPLPQHTMVSTGDSNNNNSGSCSSPPADATTSTVEPSSPKTPSGGRGESPGGQGEVTGEEEEEGTVKRTDRYSWLKDFDSSLWSNYFTSDNPHYSDC